MCVADYVTSLLKTLYRLLITLRQNPNFVPCPSCSPGPFHPSHTATLVFFQFFEQFMLFPVIEPLNLLFLLPGFSFPLHILLSNSHPLDLTFKIPLKNSPTPHSYSFCQSLTCFLCILIRFLIILFLKLFNYLIIFNYFILLIFINLCIL